MIGVATLFAWWRVDLGGVWLWWALPAACVVAGLFLVVVAPHRKYRRYGWDVRGDDVVVARGWLRRTAHLTNVLSIQTVTLLSSWLQRAFDLRTVSYDSLGGGGAIRDIPREAAADLTAHLTFVIEAVTGDGA